MAITQIRSNRKATGGRYKRTLAKLTSRKGKPAMLTKIDPRKVKDKRTRGGNAKEGLLAANKVNVFDPKTKKYVVAEITNALENPANRHFVRRNIMTKGAIIETSKGKAKITSRPGQEGTINAILI